MGSRNVLLKVDGERDLVFGDEIQAEAYVVHVLLPMIERRGLPGIIIHSHAYSTDTAINAKMICEDGVWSCAIIH